MRRYRLFHNQFRNMTFVVAVDADNNNALIVVDMEGVFLSSNYMSVGKNYTIGSATYNMCRRCNATDVYSAIFGIYLCAFIGDMAYTVVVAIEGRS